LTVPVLEPLEPPVIDSQEFELAAVHAHPLAADTATLPVVDVFATDRVVGESV
jgi:hypothetical protein